jgi:hypothetical protein
MTAVSASVKYCTLLIFFIRYEGAADPLPVYLSLPRMKKCIGYILFLYILFCALVPCTFNNKCDSEGCTEQTSRKDANRDCNSCSPFSICSFSGGFTIGTIATLTVPDLCQISLVYKDYYFSYKPAYYASHFQPPRAG